jgi:hypothetical protein
MHSRNHCCSGKAISITHSERVFVALGIQHAMCMHDIILLSVSVSTIFFHIILQAARFPEKKNVEHKMSILIFSTTFV